MEFAGLAFDTREDLTIYFVKSFYQDDCENFLDEAVEKVMDGFGDKKNRQSFSTDSRGFEIVVR